MVVIDMAIKTVPISDLAPTQMTVGMREVELKRRRWRERSACQVAQFLGKVRVPVVFGPRARHYLIDRHHLALALQDEGIRELPVSVVANMGDFGFEDFWTSIENRNWTHPFDDEGRRRRYSEMPDKVDDLKDDPFRSLAGAVKRAGGYAKVTTPFSEFRWADFLRGRTPRELVECNFGRALTVAMQVAQGREAMALPGWRRFPD